MDRHPILRLRLDGEGSLKRHTHKGYVPSLMRKIAYNEPKTSDYECAFEQECECYLGQETEMGSGETLPDVDGSLLRLRGGWGYEQRQARVELVGVDASGDGDQVVNEHLEDRVIDKEA